jgi:hypothetical protein
MQRYGRMLPGFVVCLVVIVAPGWGTVESGVVSVGNNATVTFPHVINPLPVVVCSAQVNGQALMAAATNVTTTNFRVLIRDTANNIPAGNVWVQWVAAANEAGVRCGTASVSQGQTITFPSAFPTTPTVVTSGTMGDAPCMVAAINNAKANFGVWFKSHSGSTSGTAQVSWIATVPRSTWRCGVTRYNDRARLSFAALPAVPTIVTSGNGGEAVATCAVSNAADGALLTLRRHNGSAAQNVWLQWWALPAGMASYTPPLVAPH